MRIGSLTFESATGSGNSLLGTPTDHGLPIGQGPDVPIVWTDAPIDGEILIGVTGSDPALSTLTAGTGISISNGPGSITISASSTGIGWDLITTSQTLVVNRGYICIGGGALSLALPSATLGDVIYVILDGSTSWTLTQGGGSSILFGFQSTSAGGTLATSQQGDAIYLVCQNGSRWNAISMVGNLIAT